MWDMIIKGQAQFWSVWAIASRVLRDEVVLPLDRELELKVSNQGYEIGLRLERNRAYLVLLALKQE